MAYQLDSHDFYDVAAAFSTVSRRINTETVTDVSHALCVIDTFRDLLKNEDRDGFFDYYSDISGRATYLFDFLMGEVFEVLNIQTVEELL